MTQITTIDRRKALSTLGMAGAVALVTPAAALPKLTATEDKYLLDLWQCFVAAEVQYADAVSNSDHADWNAHQELYALSCPWTPLNENNSDCTVVEVARRMDITLTPTELVRQDGNFGPWLVQEYQPQAKSHPFVTFQRDVHPVRWQPYPDATSAEEAYGLAKARADREWRSFDGKRSAISRKHQVRKYSAGVETASEACGDIRHAIATAPVTGALALAIKLAMWGWGSDMDLKSASRDDPWDDIEAAAVASLYKHAVKESGFDPLAQARKALRDYERHSA